LYIFCLLFRSSVANFLIPYLFRSANWKILVITIKIVRFVDGGGVEAAVMEGDIRATNGIIHVIDKVTAFIGLTRIIHDVDKVTAFIALTELSMTLTR